MLRLHVAIAFLIFLTEGDVFGRVCSRHVHRYLYTKRLFTRKKFKKIVNFMANKNLLWKDE